MALPPTPHVSRRTWLDRRAARRRRGRRCLEGAAGLVPTSALFALSSPITAILCAVLAAYLVLVAIDAGLPWED